MKRLSWLPLVIGSVFLAGCAGLGDSTASYQSVDLEENLDEATLSRYQQELKDATAAGGGGHMFALEKTNDWPLGLLAYWRRGTVKAMHSPGGYHYMVKKATGFGPLSLLYVAEKQSVYDAQGKRQMFMGTDSILWGHLAMTHTMGSALSGDHWMEHRGSHYLHHLLNFVTEHGSTSFSFGSSPNPMGFGD